MVSAIFVLFPIWVQLTAAAPPPTIVPQPERAAPVNSPWRKSSVAPRPARRPPPPLPWFPLNRILCHSSEPDESDIGLAQYRFTSIAALEGKLARYPRGTAFVLQRSANETGDVTAAISKLMAFAAAQGLSIIDQR